MSDARCLITDDYDALDRGNFIYFGDRPRWARALTRLPRRGGGKFWVSEPFVATLKVRGQFVVRVTRLKAGSEKFVKDLEDLTILEGDPGVAKGGWFETRYGRLMSGVNYEAVMCGHHFREDAG